MQTFYCSTCATHYELEPYSGPPKTCKKYDCELIPVQAKMYDLPSTGRDPLLTKREKTHGNFLVTARVAQELKNATHVGSYLLKDKRQREAVDMICTKLARILSGNCAVKDHWDDIAGYAKLGSEACDG